ncbi:MAG: putative beta-barrel porin 2, partial [Spartobacteria bacterium]|nr:putative beta-barrel porin 2 [Spartobacteria bacterium]
GIENGDASRNENRTTFRTGLTASHNLTSRIAAVLSAYYAHDTYSSISTPGVINPSFMQDSFDLNLSLRYSINRYLGLSTGLDYSKVTSDSTFSDYSRTRVWGGFNFIF